MSTVHTSPAARDRVMYYYLHAWPVCKVRRGDASCSRVRQVREEESQIRTQRWLSISFTHLCCAQPRCPGHITPRQSLLVCRRQRSCCLSAIEQPHISLEATSSSCLPRRIVGTTDAICSLGSLDGSSECGRWFRIFLAWSRKQYACWTA